MKLTVLILALVLGTIIVLGVCTAAEDFHDDLEELDAEDDDDDDLDFGDGGHGQAQQDQGGRDAAGMPKARRRWRHMRRFVDDRGWHMRL